MKPTIKCKPTIITCTCVQFKFCTGTMASFVAISDKENLAPDAKWSKLSLKLKKKKPADGCKDRFVVVSSKEVEKSKK